MLARAGFGRRLSRSFLCLDNDIPRQSTREQKMTLHGFVRQCIQTAYYELNRLTCPWDGSEAKALTKMIESNPSWTEQDWAKMVRNYFDSHGVNGDRPRKWLANISRYVRGPLDQYGKVHEAPAYLTVGETLAKYKAFAEGPPHAFCLTCGCDLGELKPEEAGEQWVCNTEKCREGWEI